MLDPNSESAGLIPTDRFDRSNSPSKYASIARVLAAAYLQLLAKHRRVRDLAPPSDSPEPGQNGLAISASEVAHVRVTRADNPRPGEEI